MSLKLGATKYMIPINENAFEPETSVGISITQFSTQYCGTCRLQERELLKSSQSFPNIKFFKIDAEECKHLTNDLNIKSVPTLILVKDGKVIDKHNDFHKSEDINKLLQNIV